MAKRKKYLSKKEVKEYKREKKRKMKQSPFYQMIKDTKRLIRSAEKNKLLEPEEITRLKKGLRLLKMAPGKGMKKRKKGKEKKDA